MRKLFTLQYIFWHTLVQQVFKKVFASHILESIKKEILHLKGFTVLSYVLQNYVSNTEILNSVLRILGLIVLEG